MKITLAIEYEIDGDLPPMWRVIEVLLNQVADNATLDFDDECIMICTSVQFVESEQE